MQIKVCFNSSVSLVLYRHALASLHFNENVQRERQIGKNGAQYLKVCYPKYKLGEEVVRDVKTPPTYGMTLCRFSWRTFYILWQVRLAKVCLKSVFI